MRFFKAILSILILVCCACNQNSINDDKVKIREINYVELGYYLKASNRLSVSQSHFLWCENSLYNIVSENMNNDTLQITDFKENLLKPILDSLPIFQFNNDTIIGNLRLKNDNAPWFVNVYYGDSTYLKIGSNNLPMEFYNYDKVVIALLQKLYNGNFN